MTIYKFNFYLKTKFNYVSCKFNVKNNTNYSSNYYNKFLIID